MNTYNINNDTYKQSESYQNFLSQNPSQGFLKIRAYAASSAIPIQGLKIMVSTIIDNNKVIFFDGFTDESGLTPKISLPAPKLDSNNMNVPDKMSYEILATYIPDNLSETYRVNIYENICVVQNISIVPDMNMRIGDILGS